jgi:ribosomal protein S18 acetylase RimI-like enzyme
MAAAVTVRAFRPDDAAACGAIVEATPLWRRYGLTSDLLAQRLLESSEPVFVAEHEDVCVGFAWVLRRGAFGRSAYLRLIAVEPALRGQGIGEALLRAFEAVARDVGSDAFLLVSEFNAAAQRFYLREGYEQVGRLDGFVLPDVAELLFRKRLAAP